MKYLFIILILSSVSFSGFAAESSVSSAYQARTSNVQVRSIGTVIKILADDNKGARHQKFIVKLASGQTVLIAHNIDLARRINSINIGDSIEFYGEYEWNAKGGIVHWTHHDPAGRHKDGWLKHNGVLYK
tara:strand:- start:16691 stop:17080 length:390 start_codon:yes stop_codon:yes gene_type:complete